MNKRNCAKQEPDAQKKTMDKSSERVTLKKEIGLLSACAIIIGEITS